MLALLVLLGFSSGDDKSPVTPDQAARDPEYLTVSGVVTSINLDGMAVDGPARIVITDAAEKEHVIAIPSMGINLCTALDRLASVAEISSGDKIAARGQLNENQELVPCESDEHYLTVTGRHVDAALGFQFGYRKGPDGYVLVENDTIPDADFMTGLTLFRRVEYEAFQQASDAREGPAFLQVRVYDNTQKLWPAVWALRNPGVTNYARALGEPSEAVVGGANAVHIVADGLWPIETYVVANDSMIFLLQAMAPDEADSMNSDFQELVASFEFIRPSRFEDTE